jgi:hypothetical protein
MYIILLLKGKIKTEIHQMDNLKGFSVERLFWHGIWLTATKSKYKAMKKLILFMSAIAMVSIISCTTEYYDSGIPGPQGPQGPSGESSFVFEYTEVTFFAPDFEVILEHPVGFQGVSSDVALVYFLWDQQDINGSLVDVWRPLPQQVFAPFGTIQYNYDFTANDVRLFMEGNFSAADLAPIDTDDWVVRVVIVPGDFWSGGRASYPAYSDVIKQFDYEEPVVQRHEVQSRR